VIELEADAEGDGMAQQQAEARRLLEGVIAADAIAPHPAGLSMAVPNASKTIPSLLRQLDSGSNGLRIAGLEMHQPSLDDVFMKYTGRSIREEAADQPLQIYW